MSSRHFFTEEEKSWLASQDPSLSYKQLAILFNQQFNANVTWCSMREIVGRKLGIIRTGKHGQFIEGHDAAWKYPIGTEKVFNGYSWIKIRDDIPEGMPTNKVWHYQWQLKSRYIWEQAFGSLSDDEIVIFLDGDKQNNNLDNLYAISRGVHAIMCKNQWYNGNPDFVKAAIRTSELIKEVSRIKKGCNNDRKS